MQVLWGVRLGALNFVDHVLLVYEVAGALDEAEELADVRRPLRQRLVRAHLGGEDDEPGGSVHFGEDLPRAHQLGELLLRLVARQAQQGRQATQPNPLVVLGRDAQVVLGGPLVRQQLPVRKQGLQLVPRQQELEVGLHAALGGEGKADDFAGGEELEGLLPVGQLGQPLVQRHPVQHVRLHGCACGEAEEEHSALEVVAPPCSLVLVLAFARSLIHGVVGLGELEGVLLAKVEVGQQAVVPELEVLHVDLLQELALHLLRHDGHPHPVLIEDAESDLVEDEVDLLPLGERPVRLHVHLQHGVARTRHVALRLLDCGEFPGELCSLGLHVDLPVRHVPKRSDQSHLASLVGNFLGPLHRLGDHCGDGVAGLLVPLRDRCDGRVQFVPVATVEAELRHPRDDGFKARDVVSEPAFFFEGEERLDASVQLPCLGQS
mmetsp:Transcript_16665/g.38584  ORF Transcript_16665/g.38584 Transcript_16665/m.38584 type:complete len:434 (+) Transcript_16665:327-1628(+)